MTARTALVAGATGFIGSAVCRRLLANGWQVVAPVRRYSQQRHRLANLSRLRVVEVGEWTAAELRPAFAQRPDVVLNLASAGVSGKVDPEQAVAGNVTLTLNLLRVAGEVGVRRFVHTGSCFEYAAVPSGERMTESSPAVPWSVYGAAKLASVYLARTAAEVYGVPVVVLRLFGVFGPGEAPPRLLPYLITRLRNREPADLSPGTQVRDLLFIDDAVAAFTVAADTALLDGHVYNVCSGVPVVVREVGEAVARLLAAPPELLRWGAIPPRAGEPPWIVGDPTAFRNATGWAPRFDLNAGLQATIDGA
ncbi:MAG: NAD(P)-dependent oxidoreductase [Fimbriiglobus sp.]|nr:NAD(P)-dependent oxidoreductase [Fimbriiglobus sp.]